MATTWAGNGVVSAACYKAHHPGQAVYTASQITARLRYHSPTMATQPAEPPRPAPRLYLVTPLVEDAAAFARLVEPLLGTADIAAVLLRLAHAGESELIRRVKALAPVIQRSGAA